MNEFWTAFLGFVSPIIVALIAAVPVVMKYKKDHKLEEDKRFDEIKDLIKAQNVKMGVISDKLSELQTSQDDYQMENARARFLEVSDKINDKACPYPSYALMQQAMKDCDDYEQYAETHSDFHNGIGEASVKHIRDTFDYCIKNDLFGKEKT